MIFMTEASRILGIATPTLEYVKDFPSVGQCVDNGLKVKLCENWGYTERYGSYCRYLIIAHEMVHSKQHQTGEQIDHWNGTTFKGRFISDKEYSEMPNEEVPWEVEANEIMWNLRDQVIDSLAQKEIFLKKGPFKPNVKL